MENKVFKVSFTEEGRSKIIYAKKLDIEDWTNVTDFKVEIIPESEELYIGDSSEVRNVEYVIDQYGLSIPKDLYESGDYYYIDDDEGNIIGWE